MPSPNPERPKSYGNISDAHWTRARAGENQEALEYYRARSKAPGVAEGGAERNHYCMACDGVIPLEPDAAPEVCPHCGAPIEGRTRRYFNWVEIDQPGEGDFRAVLPFLLLAGLVLAGAAFALWRLFA